MHLESLFRILTEVWLAGEILIAVLTRTRRGQGTLLDHGTQIILWIVIVASIWIEGRMHDHFAPDMPGSQTWLRPLAFGILLFGLVLRAVAVFSLGKGF